MAHAENHSRSGVSRRDALRMLAASTTTVAAGSVIISQPAFADNGSVACGYTFKKIPTMNIDLTNEETKADQLSISIKDTNGGCGCIKKKPTMRYAYYVRIPGTGSGGVGWITSDTASVSSPAVLWGLSGGSVTVSVGVQVTCEGQQGPVVQCWYGTAQIQVGPAKSKVKQDYPLNVSNSNSNPTGIPACQSSARQAAPLLAGGSINMVAGLAPATIDAPVLERTIAPETPSTTSTPSSTTTATTPSTTTPSTTTPSTTTSTTAPPSSTTTTPSTTTPSTTIPPSTTLPPGG